MRLVRRLSLLGTSIVALAAFACNDPARPSEPMGDAQLSVLAGTKPYIRGVITQATVNGGATLDQATGGFRVEEKPGAEDGAKAGVSWTGATTRIVRRHDGRTATPDELAVGVTVSVWTTGIERRSLPPQVDARLIVVE